jgi:hypothetical protein
MARLVELKPLALPERPQHDYSVDWSSYLWDE